MEEDGSRSLVQKQFNFTHAERIGIIRRCQLPEISGCKGSTLKAVLNALNSYGGHECWPSVPTIASATQLSVRQVKRAIEALQSLSLICVQKRKSRDGAVCNHYRLVWSELELLCRDKTTAREQSDFATRRPATRPESETNPSIADADHTSFFDFERSATTPERGAIFDERSATATDRSAMVAPKMVLNNPRNNYHHHHQSSYGVHWPAVVAELISLGISSWRKVLDCALARGLSEEEFLEQIAEARATMGIPANAKLFRQPAGAIAWFLREGAWPCGGVMTPSAAAAKERQSHLDEMDRIIRAGREKGAPHDLIRIVIRKHIPAEICEEHGW